jgi:iron complex transport system substrate-binding protein
LVIGVAGCGHAPKPVARTNKPRVVCLAPNLTEIVSAIGAADCLVGRSSACDYPPDIVRNVPVVGDFGKPSMEMLVATRPTLVLEVDMEDESFRAEIERHGIKAERIVCHKLDDIPEACLKIGRLLNHEIEARELAGRLTTGIAELRRTMKPEGERPLVFAEIWHDPLTTAGRNSFLSDLIALAGGRNAGDEVEQDYYLAAPEWVVSANPDIILDLHTKAAGSLKEQFLSRPGWQNVKAVKTGRVYGGFKTDLILRPGPRVLEGIKELRKYIEQPAAATQNISRRGAEHAEGRN